MIKAEDWDSWKEHPVTRDFFAWIESKREGLKEHWARGSFTGPSFEETQLKNVAATGATSAYEEVLEVDLEQLNGDLYEPESRG